ncbi:MAG: hypothetical protein ABIJ39_09075 [Chloroflexota bacterium]
MASNLQPLHTSIEKIISSVIGIVILEHHFNFPSRESNLYCVKDDGTILWKAEKPDPNTLFNRVKLNENFTLSAYTIHGHACELDLKKGTLLDKLSIA